MTGFLGRIDGFSVYGTVVSNEPSPIDERTSEIMRTIAERENCAQKYKWPHPPYYYGMPKLEQVRELVKRGASPQEIKVILDIVMESVTGYLRKLYSPARPKVVNRKSGLIDRIVTKYTAIVPASVARSQAAWEVREKIVRAKAAGATYTLIANSLGLSKARVGQLALRHEMFSGSESPLEFFLNARGHELNIRTLAKSTRELLREVVINRPQVTVAGWVLPAAL